MKAIQIKQYGGEEQLEMGGRSKTAGNSGPGGGANFSDFIQPHRPKSRIGQYAPGLPLEVSFHPGW